jgi:glucuronosyltransferase
VEDLKKEKFDLVLVNLMLNDCAYPFARLYGAPLVLLGPGAGSLHWDFGVANPEPTSYVPNLALPFTDHMTFFERLMNTLFAVFGNFIRYFQPKLFKGCTFLVIKY